MDIFGCRYCAGMGFTDYPSNQKPCPIPSHTGRAQGNEAAARIMVEANRRPYSPDCGKCPYCFAAGNPVGIDCIHWTGLGWSREGKNEQIKDRTD